MNCGYCRAPVSWPTTACGRCGQPINWQPVTASGWQGPNQQWPKPQTLGGSITQGFGFGCGCLLLLLVIVVAFLVMVSSAAH